MASVENTTTDNYIIKSINKETVHRICSGQVVLSLAIAVKELVENAIDAGATIINIHLREYGSELVEVSDNGSGVCKDNFQALTLKHYTSKLRDFNDLAHISTLGFRGEALSSLCALCDLSITTKHINDDIATKICYDRNGKITSQCATAREQGTKVTLEHLFNPLPVRRKEFLKNLKREFSKMCQLLYAYCLVSKNIKFTCTNVTAKSPKNTVVSTEGHKTVRENIISVFGVKQLASLIEVTLVSPDTDIITEFNIELDPDMSLKVPFSFEFMISTVSHGRGRGASDRQFYFINSRPCEPTKLIRLVNDIYKQFNNKQYPFVYLNIITNSTTVDVNVTPDKRQIFLEKEKILLATVKASLLESFKQFPSTYEVQNLNAHKSLILNNSSAYPSSTKGIKRSLTDSTCLERTILERFCKTNKRCKSDESCDRKLSLNATKTDEIVEETLTKTVCKLSEENSVIENIVDSDDVSEILENVEISIDKPIVVHQKTSRKTLDINLNDIKRLLEKRNANKTNGESIQVKFRSEINPGNNKNAEEELQRHIAKDDFRKMDIVGQFNLSFVIVNFNGDLFIVDQHASDEKYNFEQLQLHTVIESQNLVCAKPLDLTAASETILIDNENVFKKNGFEFKIDHEAPSTKKISLLSVPLSQKFVFGKSDIDEMIFMLQDANHSIVVPTRLRAMFASRACRKSIMVGKALSGNDMRKLVDHMGEIEQPWNCPHGRPTMRHLINLNLVVDTI